MADISSGAQFENTLYNQLVRSHTLQYYALKTGHEIDFIVNGSLAIEAKETPAEHDLTYLKRMSSKIDLHNYRLIGRYQSPEFANYTWAGSVL